MNQLAAADAYCKLLTRSHYENFSVASGFLPLRVRLDLMRIYAYCRTTDDLGDESGSAAMQRLERWRGEVAALFAGEAPVHPVLVALHETVAAHAFTAEPFLNLIEANARDQRDATYESWAQLEEYCMLSAAPVGRMVLRVFGLSGPLIERLSDDVCIGLQLANHAQDVRRDARIGRTYLVQPDIRAQGIAGAVRALCARARTLLAAGVELEAMAPFALRAQLSLYRLGGQAICDAVEAIDFRTDLHRPRVSSSKKVELVLRALIQALRPSATVRDASAV